MKDVHRLYFMKADEPVCSLEQVRASFATVIYF